MKKEEVVEKIRSIVIDNFIMDEVDEDESIFSTSCIDSLDMLIIAMDMEKTFNIEIDDDSLQRIANSGMSINQLADELIQRYGL